MDPFLNTLERIQRFRETGNLKHIYKNKLDKAYFAYDTAYSNGKGLAKRTITDKILKNRAFEDAISPKNDEYQRGLLSMLYKLFDKKTGSEAIVTSKMRESINEELAKTLNKSIIKKFKKREVYARYKHISICLICLR